MTLQNLPKRAFQNATAALCLGVLLSSTAPAMTRSTRAHAHPAAQEQEPVQTRARSRKLAAERPSRPAAKASARTAARQESKLDSRRSKPSRREREEEQYEAPVTMKRASRNSKAPKHVEPLVETRVEHHVTHTIVATPKPQPKPAPKLTAELDAAANKAATEHKTLTTADFLRAAAGQPPTDSPATGVSQPDEMDETAPLASQSKPVITASVSANDSPKLPTPAPSTRVDGFGPEGAPAHRTLAATLAARRSKPVPPPVISPEEREEITDEAIKPNVLPALYTRGGRLIMPAPLKGSHEILVHQNTMADSEGLDRIQDDDDLNRMVSNHLLARFPENNTLHVNSDLPENRRYARPWTVHFAVDAAKAFSDHFREPLQINSAVRTVSFQLRLMRTNGNAAAVDGDTASPHLTGQAIDIAKRGMSQAELAWMRAYLLPLMQAGKVDVEEEFQQACFHISVYRSYLPAKKKAAKTEVAADSDAPDALPIRRNAGSSLR